MEKAEATLAEVTLGERLSEHGGGIVDVAASVALLGEALKRENGDEFHGAVELGWCLCRILERKLLDTATALGDLAKEVEAKKSEENGPISLEERRPRQDGP